MERPAHKDELKKLFEKQDQGALDDFEREALEGFAMLESQQEAHKAKAELDQRMERAVFSDKKRSLSVYWYAAACLILVAGFSIYFLQGNDHILVPEKNMAFEQKLEEKPVSASVPAAPAEMQKQAESADAINKKGSVEEEPALARKDAAGQKANDLVRDAENNKGGMGPGSAAPRTTGETTETLADKRAQDDEGSVDRTLQEADAKTAARPVMDELSKSEMAAAPTQEKAAEPPGLNNVKAPGRAANERQQPVSADSRAREEEKESAGKKLNRKKSKVAASEAPATEVAYKSDKDESKETGKESENKLQDAAANQPAVSGSLSQNANGNTAGFNYYWVPDESTYKQLRETLAKENLSRGFSAVLKVSKDKSVKEVVLSAHSFTQDEQTRLIAILKQLKDFDLKGKAASGDLYVLKIDFKP